MTLKAKLRRIWWGIVGCPDYPPTDGNIATRISQYSGKFYVPRSFYVYIRYANGESIEDIATSLNVTRERIRQILWKEYRHLN